MGIIHQELPTQDELKTNSIRSLKVHPKYEKILHEKKDDITRILQGVIDIMNDRLARGEEVPTKHLHRQKYFFKI